MNVLVCYATAHGSTQGVAQRLGKQLLQRGLNAEVRAITDAGDPTAFDAVVIGSAIHGAKWLPTASGYVDGFATELRDRPTWLFSVSTLGDRESMFPLAVAERLRRLRKQTSEMTSIRAALGSRDHRNFAGTIRRSDWPLTGRLTFRAMGGRYGDFRNWGAIDSWADEIAADLATNSAAPPREQADAQ